MLPRIYHRQLKNAIMISFFLLALSVFASSPGQNRSISTSRWGQQRDDRCRYIEGEEPQDDADHEMIEERLWEQV